MTASRQGVRSHGLPNTSEVPPEVSARTMKSSKTQCAVGCTSGGRCVACQRHLPEVARATPVLEHLWILEAALIGELSALDGLLGQQYRGT